VECWSEAWSEAAAPPQAGLGFSILARAGASTSGSRAVRSCDRQQARGCDLVKVPIGELVSGGRIRQRAIVIQQKTGRPVQFELLEPARTSLLEWLERRGGSLDNFVFPSRTDHSDHISTRQYARLVDEWVTAIGLRREDYGTHSLRRTKAALIYKQTGNLRAVQILLGHTKIETTVRYLGVEVEDALTLAEATEV